MAPQEIAIVWRHDDGTRCALFVVAEELELRVLRDDRVLRQQPVNNVAYALAVLAPVLQVWSALGLGIAGFASP